MTNYKVTNPADYAHNATPIPGTLRYGIEEIPGPRRIIFENDMEIRGIQSRQHRWRVEGQQDVQFVGRDAGTRIAGALMFYDCIGIDLKDLRVRPGNEAIGNQWSGTQSCLTFVDSQATVANCSLLWGVNENITVAGYSNVLVKYTILGEALEDLPYNDKYGALIFGGNCTFDTCLFQHNYDRNPRVSAGQTNIINCLAREFKNGCNLDKEAKINVLSYVAESSVSNAKAVAIFNVNSPDQIYVGDTLTSLPVDPGGRTEPWPYRGRALHVDKVEDTVLKSAGAWPRDSEDNRLLAGNGTFGPDVY